MEYEQTHTHRYQYRRMGLVPYKDGASRTNWKALAVVATIIVTILIGGGLDTGF